MNVFVILHQERVDECELFEREKERVIICIGNLRWCSIESNGASHTALLLHGLMHIPTHKTYLPAWITYVKKYRAHHCCFYYIVIGLSSPCSQLDFIL